MEEQGRQTLAVSCSTGAGLFPKREYGTVGGGVMRVISRSTLRDFWSRPGCDAAKQPLLLWFREVKRATWQTPADIKQSFGTADVVGEGRVVFNIGGNKFRLVAWVSYAHQLVLVKWVGTHAEYDRIDVTLVGLPRRTGR
jgi:mRNA interferase HigB